MANVVRASARRREGESFESLFHRFKRSVNDGGVLNDLKKHEFYESKSVKRRKKREAAKQKRLKQERAQRRRLARMD